MSKKGLFAGTKVVAVLTSIAAMGLFASNAFALSIGENVAGTTVGSLSLTAGTGAALLNFSPGNTASGTGLLTATDTSGTWNLDVKDTASSNAGKMQAAALGCTGSDPVLTNALQVSVTPQVSLTGATADPAVSLSGTNQEVAAATNQLLAANTFTTNYSQVIPAGQVLLTGCVYSLTATYTLQ